MNPRSGKLIVSRLWSILFFILTPLILSGQLINNPKAKEVKIAAFNYYPGIFQDETGEVKGFFVDLLKAVAERENWKLKFVYGSWSEGLDRVKSGEVDVLTSVAYTSERSKYVDYSRNSILTVRGAVYVRENSYLAGLTNLENKSIGVMKDDFIGRTFTNHIKFSQIECNVKAYNDFESIFKDIAADSIDAGIVNNIFGVSKSDQYNLKSAGIIFNPFEIYFTTAKLKNSQLLQTIDNYLDTWKADNNSIYYKSFSKWSYKQLNDVNKTPDWVSTVVYILIAAIILTVVFIIILRKKVREATLKVTESELVFKKLAESVNVISWEFDLIKDKWNYVAPQSESMLGYKPEEWINFDWWTDKIYAEDREAVVEFCMAKTEEGEDHTFEYRLTKKDGSIVWILDIVKVHMENNVPVILRGTMIDINDRKTAEFKLKESEERYQQLAGASFEAIFFSDKGICVNQNKTAEQMFGYTLEEALGRPGTEWIHPDYRDVVMKNMMSGYEEPYEVIALRKDGTTFPCEIQGRMTSRDDKPLRITVLRDITRRKLAEESYLKSDRQLKSAMDLAKLAYWEYDMESDEFTFNDQFYNIFRTSVEEVGGYKLKSEEYAEKFLHPDDAPLIAAEIKRAMESDDPNFSTTLEHRVFYADGEEGYLSVRYFISKDSTGKTTSGFGINQDITERKRVEKELKERNDFIETVLDNLPIGVAYNSLPDGNVIYLNKKFEKIYGWPADKLKSVEEFFNSVYPDPEYREQIKQRIMTDLSSGDVSRMHWESIKITDENGREKIINAQNIPLFEQNTMVSTVIDITQQYQAEQEIKESDEKHRKLISNISEVIVILDAEGIIQYKSPNIKNMFGWDPEDLVGKPAMITVHSDDQQRIGNEFTELIKEDFKKVTVEYNYKCKDGTYRPIELTAVNLLHDKTINGIIANYKDISDRKKAEKAVVESQRLGAIGEMSSAVAHDFNNSLQSIFGNLELALLNPNIPEKVKKYLEVIQIAASDASTRVKLLQRFAGSKTLKSEYNNVDLNGIVQDVIVQSRPLWKDNLEKNGKVITIETEYQAQSQIHGNEGELRSVVYNIVKNSIESMPDGGRLSFSTGQSDEGVFVKISDTGAGMDEATKSRLFQPFYTTKGFEAGRGLGMSGAYGIVQEHGGILRVVHTGPGEGTTIEMVIPATSAAESKVSEVSSQSYIDDVNILWVDDDETIRDIGQNMLTELGYSGDIAKNGKEALEHIEVNKYDLIVTDIGMPGMSGWELADSVRAKYGNNIKIALLSGWGAQIEQDELDEHRIDFILAKPFRIYQLQQLINEAFSDRGL